MLWNSQNFIAMFPVWICCYICILLHVCGAMEEHCLGLPLREFSIDESWHAHCSHLCYIFIPMKSSQWDYAPTQWLSRVEFLEPYGLLITLTTSFLMGFPCWLGQEVRTVLRSAAPLILSSFMNVRCGAICLSHFIIADTQYSTLQSKGREFYFGLSF